MGCFMEVGHITQFILVIDINNLLKDSLTFLRCQQLDFMFLTDVIHHIKSHSVQIVSAFQGCSDTF